MLALPVGSFPKKDLEKNQNRLTELLLIIFGKIADNFIKKKPDPYRLQTWEICNHKGRQNKALDILSSANALPESRREYTQYGQGSLSYDYEQLFVDHAESYAEPIVFPDTPPEIQRFLADTTINSFHTNKKRLDAFGYEYLDGLRNSKKIYLYYHLHEYDFRNRDIKNYRNETDLMFYPKAMQTLRTKAVLKVLMRKYCEEDILSYLNKKLGIDLTGQEIPKDDNDDTFTFRFRNFARFPYTFNNHCFNKASKSYSKEHMEQTAKVNFEFERLKLAKSRIDAFGGCKSVLEGYIKEALDNLVGKAPTLINGEDEDKDALEYILDHRELITYDYIYN